MNTVLAPEDIKGQRLAAGMTVADLASALGVSVRTIDRWENGETFPSRAESIALEVVLSEQAGAKSSPRPRRKSNNR